MNPPLRLDAILARMQADRCPGVQACPGDSAVEQAGQTGRFRWELRELIPDAPGRWSVLGPPSPHSTTRHDWNRAAAAVLGCPVTLDCGDQDEIWVVLAPVGPSGSQEHKL